MINLEPFCDGTFMKNMTTRHGHHFITISQVLFQADSAGFQTIITKNTPDLNIYKEVKAEIRVHGINDPNTIPHVPRDLLQELTTRFIHKYRREVAPQGSFDGVSCLFGGRQVLVQAHTQDASLYWMIWMTRLSQQLQLSARIIIMARDPLRFCQRA